MFSLSNLNTAAIANTFKNSQLNASLEKLSSGSRINRAADDSAG
ncbi:MAG TPA: flagellin, partial [Alteromonas australica]|nr:flagellin [Alteromonas australica]